MIYGVCQQAGGLQIMADQLAHLVVQRCNMGQVLLGCMGPPLNLGDVQVQRPGSTIQALQLQSACITAQAAHELPGGKFLVMLALYVFADQERLICVVDAFCIMLQACALALHEIVEQLAFY